MSVPKANKLELDLSNLICQKPKLTPNFKNYVAHDKVGMWKYSCLISWLSGWDSREIPSFSFCVCTVTTPLTESVGSSGGSIILRYTIR